MSDLKITSLPRQPESYQLANKSIGTSSITGLIPPVALTAGQVAYGLFHTVQVVASQYAWAFTAVASRIPALGLVTNHVTVSMTRRLNIGAYTETSPASLIVPVDEVTVGANTYPVYVTPRDRVEIILRLWHDKGFSQSTIIPGILADILTFPVNAPVFGIELYVNDTAAPAVTAPEVYNVLLS